MNKQKNTVSTQEMQVTENDITLMTSVASSYGGFNKKLEKELLVDFATRRGVWKQTSRDEYYFLPQCVSLKSDAEAYEKKWKDIHTRQIVRPWSKEYSELAILYVKNIYSSYLPKRSSQETKEQDRRMYILKNKLNTQVLKI